MEKMKRFAVYYAPPAGDFANHAAAWLGWDPVLGAAVSQPDLGLDAAAMTGDPRKYGFHGTIKPPFRLAEGVTRDALHHALGDLAARLAPVTLPGLQMKNLDGFLALIPQGETDALLELAAEVVTALDPLRAPLTEAEIARRKPERLTDRQRKLLDLWGYPYVMEEFRFHLTLTDRLDPALATQAAATLLTYFGPVLPAPFVIGDLCLFGEAADGRFHLIHRYTLSA